LKGNSKLDILRLSDSKTPAQKEIERYPFGMETHATHDSCGQSAKQKRPELFKRSTKLPAIMVMIEIALEG